MMADAEAVVQEDMSPAQSPLVAVSFQRDINRKKKYLEAEPKALGITQIGLSLFNIAGASLFVATYVSDQGPQIPILISSLLVMIAGSVAVAAQNLHLPTLRACLGMQIVACVASIINMICTLINIAHSTFSCRAFYYRDDSSNTQEICKTIWQAQSNFYAESAVIQAALIAISATLAAYCCKVVNCCGPAPKMPVITVHVPQSNTEETIGYMTSAEE